MSTPKRIQRKRTKGWRMPENTVSVCRPGKWGNPFKVGGKIDNQEAVRLFECNMYANESLIIEAQKEFAHHRRDRIWIVANTINGRYRSEEQRINAEKNRMEKLTRKENCTCRMFIGTSNDGCSCKKYVANSNSERLEGTKQSGNNTKEIEGWKEGTYGTTSECYSNGGAYWSIEPELGRVANGVSNRMDRIKALGNAIVPQIAFEIFKAIVEIENSIQ